MPTKKNRNFEIIEAIKSGQEPAQIAEMMKKGCDFIEIARAVGFTNKVLLEAEKIIEKEKFDRARELINEGEISKAFKLLNKMETLELKVKLEMEYKISSIPKYKDYSNVPENVRKFLEEYENIR